MKTLLFVLTLIPLSAQTEPGISALFHSMRASSTDPASLQRPKAPIKIYATNDKFTKLCFISENVIYIYSDGRLTRPLYALMLNVDAVNRITYDPMAGGGAFQFWINHEITLSIGA